MSLSEKLMEELVSKTAFTIPLFGGIPVFPRYSGRRGKRLYPVSCDSRNLSRPFQSERFGRTDTAYEGHQRNSRAGGHEHRADRIFGDQEKGL